VYAVVKFDEAQMNRFIQSAKQKGWKSGNVDPYAHLTPPNELGPSGQEAMSSIAHPLPHTKRRGYYFFSINTFGSTTCKVYFLDVQSKTLYIYYYHGQVS
jgi:hypothetical protein